MLKPSSSRLPAILNQLSSTQLCAWLASVLKPVVGGSHQLCWLRDGGEPESYDVIGLFPMWSLQVVQGAQGIISHRRFAYSQSSLNQGESMLDAPRYASTQNPMTHTQVLAELDRYIGKHKLDDNTDTMERSLSFTGGLIGFVGYDYAAQVTAQIDMPQQDRRPNLYFGHYDIVIKKQNGIWQLFCEVGRHTEAVCDWLAGVLSTTGQNVQDDAQDDTQAHLEKMTLHHLRYHWNASEYAQAFDRVQGYLKAGDCYQVNLAQQLHAGFSGSPMSVLTVLDDKTHAPFAGCLQVGDFELISCSPELFLSCHKTANGDIKVITKPIKGTLPRLADPAADAAQIDTLKASEKNRSENLMIVDLLRNDLSVHAKVGSVHVPKLFEIESFAQVHHMVSTVEATLTKGTSALSVLFDALPGGSITGAPKVRAIEIIAELEKQPRGAYCGSLGYINFDGTGRFNILIRTLEFWQGKLSLWAGGGITIQSDCADEYQECMDKISGITEVLSDFCALDKTRSD